MKHLKILTVGLGIWFLCFGVLPVLAHANLSHSEPQANSSLNVSPSEIRIWFTEPVERNYSQIVLRNVDGAIVDLMDSRVDDGDPQQLYVPLSPLPNGLYTVSWRVVSATDGHPTNGSFAFGVGVAVTIPTPAIVIDETVPLHGVLVRWLNLVSFSLMIGVLGFILFVWQPITPEEQPQITHFLGRLLLAGWLFNGVAGVLMLLLQASVSFNSSLLETLGHPTLWNFVTTSAFGRLRLIRLTLWGIGLMLLGQPRRKNFFPLLFILGIGIVLTQSLFSHAAAAPDTLVAVIGDGLHLFLASLWIGGIVSFVAVIAQIHPHDTALTTRMVGYFSNYARVAVAALLVTGIYATWLQVGSLEALLNTVYGRALLIKLVLFIPLLSIAAVNMLVTHRYLQADQVVWVGRLQNLIGLEVVLALGILVAVAVMTSAPPARGIQAEREAIAKVESTQAHATGYFGMETVNNQMIHLQITPGYVGENKFIITPYDEAGNPITDASLIRLRFDYLDQDLGRSELRPQYDPTLSAYVIAGNNFSTVGHWRIRMTIQRPQQFDVVTDFEIEITTPPPPIAPVVEDSLPYLARVIATSVTGLLLIGLGGFFGFQSHRNHEFGKSGVSVLCLIIGVLFLLSGVMIA